MYLEAGGFAASIIHPCVQPNLTFLPSLLTYLRRLRITSICTYVPKTPTYLPRTHHTRTPSSTWRILAAPCLLTARICDTPPPVNTVHRPTPFPGRQTFES